MNHKTLSASYGREEVQNITGLERRIDAFFRVLHIVTIDEYMHVGMNFAGIIQPVRAQHRALLNHRVHRLADGCPRRKLDIQGFDTGQQPESCIEIKLHIDLL